MEKSGRQLADNQSRFLDECCSMPVMYTAPRRRPQIYQCFECRPWSMTAILRSTICFAFLLQYFLTGQQQNRLDHERRLTADHMRRLNQVLAGHLSYLEVSKVHADREYLLAAAPAHGSAVGDSSSRDDVEDSKEAPRRASPRQAILRRLVRPSKDPKRDFVKLPTAE